MQTHDRKVIDVLGDQKRFVVPFYQRHYRWDQKLWLSFWEDVLTKAEEELDGRSKFDHYMGALILSPESFTVAMTPRLQIVDGQQRLTTFQLFLVALRETGNALGYPEIGEAVRNYLFNQPMSGDLGEEARFKLIPNRADRAIFYTLIGDGMDAVQAEHRDWFFSHGGAKKSYAPNAVRAVQFFEQRIMQYARSGFVEEPESETAEDVLPEQADDEPELARQRLQRL